MEENKYVYVLRGEHKGKVGLLDASSEDGWLVYFDCHLGDEYDIISPDHLTYAQPYIIREYIKRDPIRSSLLGLVEATNA